MPGSLTFRRDQKHELLDVCTQIIHTANEIVVLSPRFNEVSWENKENLFNPKLRIIYANLSSHLFNPLSRVVKTVVSVDDCIMEVSVGMRLRIDDDPFTSFIIDALKLYKTEPNKQLIVTRQI